MSDRKLHAMKPSVAQRVLLSIGLALSTLFGLNIYLTEYGSTLMAALPVQIVRIVVCLLALILGFGGKKKITFGLIYFGTFLIGIIANLLIGYRPLLAIFRGLFTIRPWSYLYPREIVPFAIISIVVNAPFVIAFFLRSKNVGPRQATAPVFHSQAMPLSQPYPDGVVRTVKDDLESLAGMLREGLINQDDYDRKKEEILRRL